MTTQNSQSETVTRRNEPNEASRIADHDGGAALVAFVVAFLVAANWATVRDHVEAWHFQLTRETETVTAEVTSSGRVPGQRRGSQEWRKGQPASAWMSAPRRVVTRLIAQDDGWFFPP
jgi:hypothetical protein